MRILLITFFSAFAFAGSVSIAEDKQIVSHIYSSDLAASVDEAFKLKAENCPWGKCGDWRTQGSCDIHTGNCDCYYGYKGNTCQELICPADRTCSNQGTCDEGTGFCTCFHGYKGNNCQDWDGVQYQALVHFINQYGQTSYLDTCNQASCNKNRGGLGVETNRDLSRDKYLTSTWKIQSKNGKSGNITDGDIVYITNQYIYQGRQTYLDSCGSSGRRGYNVETTNELGRDEWDKNSSWQIKLKDGNSQGQLIKNRDLVYLVNQYGQTSYLDTFGHADCAKNGFHVETTPDLTRDDNENTSTWQIVLRRINTGECATESGPEPNKPCVFPFNFNGTTYSECTSVDHDQLWCSVEVDSNQNHIGGKWGNCKTPCSVNKG